LFLLLDNFALVLKMFLVPCSLFLLLDGSALVS
jgi:hypothetical protein